MTVEDLITEVSGRTWDEVRPYVEEFTVVVTRIIAKTRPDTNEEIIEIGAAVWSSMEVQGDLNDVLDGEREGKVVSLRRRRLGIGVPRETLRT